MSTSVVSDIQASDIIRSFARSRCYLCDTAGEILYEGLRDWLFNAPGEWNFRRCQNSDCGLLWLDPTPLESDISKAYRIYFTHESSRDTVTPEGIYRRLASRVRAAYLADEFGFGVRDGSRIGRKLWSLPIRLSPIHIAKFDFPLRTLATTQKGSLLEVGCGNGDLLEMARRLGWETVGVDFDPRAVELARAKGLEVYCGRVEEIRFPANTFNLILMSHVIEHIHDPLGLLQCCYRLLRSGGKLLLATPNAESWAHSIYRADWRGLEPPRHLYIFNFCNLRQLGQRTGFVDISVCSSTRLSGVVFLQSKAIYRSRLGVPRSKPSRLRAMLVRSGITLAEQVRSKLSPLVGEELRLEAYK